MVILLIRGQKVLLDMDLADLYAVETKILKRAVRRNQDRFPSDFMFELTPEEYRLLRCQIGTLKCGQHAKYLPLAFTEQDVAMLSGVRSPRAVAVNVAIMVGVCAVARDDRLEPRVGRAVGGPGAEIRRPIQGRLRRHSSTSLCCDTIRLMLLTSG